MGKMNWINVTNKHPKKQLPYLKSLHGLNKHASTSEKFNLRRS